MTITLPPLPPRIPTIPAPPRGDYAVADAGDAIRLDVYGEPYGDRVVAFLTPEQAMNLSRALGAWAVRQPAGLV